MFDLRGIFDVARRYGVMSDASLKKRREKGIKSVHIITCQCTTVSIHCDDLRWVKYWEEYS